MGFCWVKNNSHRPAIGERIPGLFQENAHLRASFAGQERYLPGHNPVRSENDEQ